MNKFHKFERGKKEEKKKQKKSCGVATELLVCLDRVGRGEGGGREFVCIIDNTKKYWSVG